MNLTAIPPKVWKTDLEEFREKTRAFYAGEMDKGAYKSFSGYYGSYAQKGGKANMPVSYTHLTLPTKAR